jgi:hypothetical protein
MCQLATTALLEFEPTAARAKRITSAPPLPSTYLLGLVLFFIALVYGDVVPSEVCVRTSAGVTAIIDGY